MSAIDSQLERRISEHLDGQLVGPQQADLFRELLRDPKARRVMDDYAANDKLVNEALRAALHTPSRTVDVQNLPRHEPRRGPWKRVLATAAMIALAAGAWMVLTRIDPSAPAIEPKVADNTSQPDTNRGREVDRAGGEPEVNLDRLLADLPDDDVQPWWRQSADPVADDQLVDTVVGRPVVHHVSHAQLNSQQQVLGVVDPSTDTVYWLEMRNDTTAMGSSVSEL